jgi:hypothetical protein
MFSIRGRIAQLNHLLGTTSPVERQIIENVMHAYVDLYINYGLDVVQAIPEDKVFLNKFERHEFAQFGEDGITEKIFEVIGTTNKFYVDFGATETSNNSEVLHKKHGFTGVLWNCDDTTCHYANIHSERIVAENVVELFQKYNVPKEFDFLTVDVDFNDWYIVRNILREYRPRVFVTECNATFPPPIDKVVVYDPKGAPNFLDTYFGASVQAFYNLARSLGYSMVSMESMGSNMFFVRDDIKESDVFYGKNDLGTLYRTPKYGHGPCGENGQHTEECMKTFGIDRICGHRPHPEGDEYKWTTSKELLSE